MEAIDTGKVADHRKLRFTSVDDVLKEMDNIIAAERAGRLKRIGNWTVGQTFDHLASWINYGWDGFPPGANPPFFIKWILKLKRNSYLQGGMPRGVKIPRAKEGTFGTQQMTTDEGAQRLRTALLRLKNRDEAKFHSPAFGPMSHEERIMMQLRHSELHFGFLHPS